MDLTLALLLLTLVILLIILVLLVRYTYRVMLPLFFWGGPYVPSAEAITEEMVRAAALTHHDVAYDLGSGDGRLILEACAASGCRGVGVEIDRPLVEQSNIAAVTRNLDKIATFRCENMWKTDLSDATVVFLYQIPYAMNKLEQKLMNELKPGTRVVSNFFQFPTWKPSHTADRVRIYIR